MVRRRLADHTATTGYEKQRGQLGSHRSAMDAVVLDSRICMRTAVAHRVCQSGCRRCAELLERCNWRDRQDRRFVCRRSEEHTSELQSRENLVCRLLLEKKK